MPLWLKALGDFVAPLLSAALSALLGALRTKRLDAERDQLNRDAAVSRGESATEEVIAEIANDQKAIVRSDDPDELARRMSERANRAGFDRSDRG